MRPSQRNRAFRSVIPVVVASLLASGLTAPTPAQAAQSRQVSKSQKSQLKVHEKRVPKLVHKRHRKLVHKRHKSRVQGSSRQAAASMVARRGWSPRHFTCLDRLWARESGWNHRSRNRSTGAYGIPQAVPGGKMRSAGRDWRTNPRTQIRWGLGYIGQRYRTPCGAWGHSKATGWY
jgi:murein DD-endopeptidase MepM/ murein hydrolase activator NlpD